VDIDSLKAEGRLPEDYHEWWGFEDQKLFAFAREEVSKLASQEEPFNFTMLTCDTHFPDGYVCELCQEEYEDQYSNVLACSSRQVYEFVEWIKAQPFYENTTIVISGDHLTMDNDFLEEIDQEYERTIYNCIINAPVEPVNEKNRKFGTMDMFPTTLAAMGVEIEGDCLGLGTNLFSEKATLTEVYGFDLLNEEMQKRSEFYNEEILDMEEEE
jgi:phosphoglycerol transferase